MISFPGILSGACWNLLERYVSRKRQIEKDPIHLLLPTFLERTEHIVQVRRIANSCALPLPFSRAQGLRCVTESARRMRTIIKLHLRAQHTAAPRRLLTLALLAVRMLGRRHALQAVHAVHLCATSPARVFSVAQVLCCVSQHCVTAFLQSCL